jgi:hypothetical protein
MEVLEYAKDKIMMGAERQSAIISPETARMTAFHEAGHALVALKTAGANPIHKATIMPRGRSLGMVMQVCLSRHIHTFRYSDTLILVVSPSFFLSLSLSLFVSLSLFLSLSVYFIQEIYVSTATRSPTNLF